MDKIKKIGLLTILVAVAISPLASARGHGGGHPRSHWDGGHRNFGGFYGGFYGPGFGFYSGPAFGYGWRQPYYQPYYYAPPPVITVQPVTPPVYIEQNQQPLPNNYWYYCRNPEGYYPYVKQCQGQWQQVAPQPPTR